MLVLWGYGRISVNENVHEKDKPPLIRLVRSYCHIISHIKYKYKDTFLLNKNQPHSWPAHFNPKERYSLLGSLAKKGYLFQAYMKGWEITCMPFLLVRRPKRAYRCIFLAVKKSRKHSCFVIYSYLKDSAFTAVKQNKVCKRGTIFVNRRYKKGQNWCIKE